MFFSDLLFIRKESACVVFKNIDEREGHDINKFRIQMYMRMKISTIITTFVHKY